MRGRARPSDRGMTLVELAIATTILATVVVALAAGMSTAFGVFRGTVTFVDLERRANAALDKIASELADVPESALITDLEAVDFTSSISYQRQTGWADGAPVFGPVTTIAWAPDPMDPTDGKDNDGDGVIDEGVITRKAGSESPITIATNVALLFEGETDDNKDENGNGLADETGLSFSLEGGAVAIRITMTRRGPDGEVSTASAESSIRLQD